MDIDHGGGHARLGQPVEHMVDQGLARHLDQSLGPVIGQGLHAGAKACGQDHRGREGRAHARASFGTWRSNQAFKGAMAGSARLRSR